MATKAAKELQKAQREVLENKFLDLWHRHAPDCPEPEAQYKFHPKRKWTLDFAWSGVQWMCTWTGVAVEVHGGTYSGGRHTRGVGFRNDREKMNSATSLGWRVYEFTADMLEDEPVKCIELVKEALDG